VAFASAGAESLAGELEEGVPLRLGEALPGSLERAADRGAGTSVPLPDGDALLVRRVGRPRGETSLVFLARAATLLSPEILRGLGLTVRESEVLGLVARGRSTSETSAELGLSPRTVEKHLEHVHSRLGVRDRAEAVATAWAAVTAPGPARPGA
jgi:DNA-binding CsgD family transcriptional regulator